jgi:hypothetical protein
MAQPQRLLIVRRRPVLDKLVLDVVDATVQFEKVPARAATYGFGRSVSWIRPQRW